MRQRKKIAFSVTPSSPSQAQFTQQQPAERAMPPKPPTIPLATLRAGAKPHPTHFTATGPHAATQPPPPRITTIDVPMGAANEKPYQKVARLREAARVARIRDLPWTEKLVETSRVVADVVHRWFIVFIMIFSGPPSNSSVIRPRPFARHPSSTSHEQGTC
jgi:hypothetical protein